jgi:hypothetical protein
MNETLNDLIERGLAIRAQRIAEERARIAAEEEARARMRATDERLIRELLPLPLAEQAYVDVLDEHAYVRVTSPFPRAGSIKIRVQKDELGRWSLCSYEVTNPDGYFLRLQTLEEAVAYAAGVLEI